MEDESDFDFFLKSKHNVTYSEFRKSLLWFKDLDVSTKFPFIAVDKNIFEIDAEMYLNSQIKNSEKFVFIDPYFSGLDDSFNHRTD